MEELTDRLLADADALKLANVRSVAEPLGVSERSRAAVGRAAVRAAEDVSHADLSPAVAKILAAAAEAAAFFEGELTDTDDPAALPGKDVAEAAAVSAATRHYVSSADPHAGRVTRIVLTSTEPPFATGGINAAARLPDAVTVRLPESLSAAEVLPLGVGSDMADLRDTARRDFRVVAGAVAAAVFLCLLATLRSWRPALLLIATVVFGFLVTFGLTDLGSRLVRGEDFGGLDWTIPTLLFTLLTAVGVDYGVLLVERIREEQDDHGPQEGVRRAVSKTGSLISGAGLIMAGTFSILVFAGQLTGLVELGAALTLGVLIDTFLIRPVLVPAAVLLAGKSGPPTEEASGE